MTRRALTACLSLSLLSLAVAACDTAVDEGGGDGVEANFTSLYGDYFQECKQCHAPGAPGRTEDIEQSLDFSTKNTAYSTLQGTATGLTGNQSGCNGVPFIAPGNASSSLVVAALDEDVRQGFDVQDFPDCDQNAISDMTLKVGFPPSADFRNALAAWIDAGAPND
ncbi:MAG: hypothetical protein ACQEXJ_10405 [Myxococcota bacterium]